jgi:hypothetical protein
MVILRLVSFRLARFANAPRRIDHALSNAGEMSTIRAEVKAERQSILVELTGWPRFDKTDGADGRLSAGGSCQPRFVLVEAEVLVAYQLDLLARIEHQLRSVHKTMRQIEKLRSSQHRVGPELSNGQR